MLSTLLVLLGTTVPALSAPADDVLYARLSRLVLDEFAAKGWNCAPDSVSLLFASAVDWQGATSSYPDQPVGGAAPASMDFSPVLDWENEFGADPRYWQLRLVCGLDSVENTMPESGYSSPLLDRILAGVQDEGSWYSLPLRGILLADEELGFELYDRIVKLHPQSAYWHYQKALMHMEYGEVDHAWDEFKAGNSLPPGNWPQPYPLSTLYDSAYDPLNEDETLVRGVIASLSYDNVPNLIVIKEDFKIGQLFLAMGFDPAFADEMQLSAARLGQMGQITLVNQNAAAVCCGMLTDYAAEELLPASLAADEDLQQFGGIYELVTGGLGPGDVLGQFGDAFDGPGTASTPFREAYYEAAPNLDLRDIAGHDYEVEFPALEKQDWLNFSLAFQAELLEVEQRRALFAALPGPPFARLFEFARLQQ